MSTEQDQVAAANEGFYRAFESLDIREMERVWAKEGAIQCIHPGWRVLRGWDAVMASWERIFENTQEIRFTLSEPEIRVADSIAWVTLYENITSRIGDESGSAIVLATNIFEKRSGDWRMIHHHGSTVAQLPGILDPSTLN